MSQPDHNVVINNLTVPRRWRATYFLLGVLVGAIGGLSFAVVVIAWTVNNPDFPLWGWIA
jgi:hypothetical protein